MPIRFAPDHRRIEVDRTPEGTRITIRSRGRKWLAAYSLGIGVALASVVATLLMRTELPLFGSIFLSILLLLSLAGGVLGAVLELRGREEVVLTTGELLVRHGVGPFQRCRRFALAGLARFRIDLEHGSAFAGGRLTWLGWRQGTVRFDEYGRTRSMAAGLTVAEAEALLDELEKFGPRFARR